MKVAIASGKGGTGKTTVATNLAYILSWKNHSVTYVDCDVEEPNGHLFLKPEFGIKQKVYTPVPEVDESRCTGCGLCIDECPYDAIEFGPDEDVARKCNLCSHRVDNGLIPACADNICPEHCIYFGDPDEIKRAIAEKHTRRPRRSATATGA